MTLLANSFSFIYIFVLWLLETQIHCIWAFLPPLYLHTMFYAPLCPNRTRLSFPHRAFISLWPMRTSNTFSPILYIRVQIFCLVYFYTANSRLLSPRRLSSSFSDCSYNWPPGPSLMSTIRLTFTLSVQAPSFIFCNFSVHVDDKSTFM